MSVQSLLSGSFGCSAAEFGTAAIIGARVGLPLSHKRVVGLNGLIFIYCCCYGPDLQLLWFSASRTWLAG